MDIYQEINKIFENAGKQYEINNPSVKNCKYYVEFEFIESENSYSMQSRYFNTAEEAMNWYADGFDFVNTDQVIVTLMRVLFFDEDDYDIERLDDISKTYWRQ